MRVRVMLVGEEPAKLSLETVALAGDGTRRTADPSQGRWVDRLEVEAFWRDLGKHAFDLALVSAGDLPETLEDAIQQVRALPQKPEIAVLVQESETKDHLRYLAAGAYAVVPTSSDLTLLARTLAQLTSRRHEALSVNIRASQLPKLQPIDKLISQSPATQQVLRIARRVAVSNTSLLILGETGAGKEWLARAVHAESPRASGSFIAINCGAIPENLLESELFGHEKGSFTGALRTRRGYFEQAHGGTLFLDEIGEMPAQLQVRLLRVLQDRAIQRLGGDHAIEVDTRIIAATHRDLKDAIASGAFRQDLFYRLAVVTLTVPSLSERVEDIPALAEDYLNQFRQKLARHEIEGFSKRALEALIAYPWPGNVRELINVIERAVLLCEGEEIDLVDLPIEIAAPAGGAALDSTFKPFGSDIDAWIEQPLDVARLAMVHDFERRYLHGLLERHRGNLARTAQQAGIDPRTLYNKMRQLGLRKEEYKA